MRTLLLIAALALAAPAAAQTPPGPSELRAYAGLHAAAAKGDAAEIARLLAAAPDENVRDVRRAKALLDEFLKNEQTIELGETAAMILADLGGYAEAATVQRDLIASAERAGQTDVVRRLLTNLERYERREPCRTPFTEAELP